MQAPNNNPLVAFEDLASTDTYLLGDEGTPDLDGPEETAPSLVIFKLNRASLLE